MKVYDNEGVRYATPELKMMGIEAIRSTTPEFCKNRIKESIRLMFDGTEQDVINYIEESKNEFKKLSAGDIGMPVGANDIDKYSDEHNMPVKGTPYHIKGVLAHNHLLKKMGLENKYPELTSGEKVKVVYLIEQNPIVGETFSFAGEIPPEMNMDKYIDYETQFDKTFLKPLKRILDIIGWKTEEQVDMLSFLQ